MAKKKSKRVTLTKTQAQSEVGDSLLALLQDITADGEISLGEVDALRDWLKEYADYRSEIHAVAWLRDLVEAVLEDGVVTKEERVELLLGIERVMPKEQRELAQDNRLSAEARSQVVAEEEDEPSEPPATKRQIDYIAVLGGSVPKGLGRWKPAT